MEKQDLKEQYDRLLTQIREEIKELYWLFNFFFVIESALLGALFVEKLHVEYIPLAELIGLVLALYWLYIIRKQRMWRNDWVDKIQQVEERLGVEDSVAMWPKSAVNHRPISAYIFGKRGLWKLLFCLPIGFAIVWILLILG